MAADALPAAAGTRPADPAHPVAYVLLGASRQTVGQHLAGEKFPAKDAIVGAVERALAARGYEPARRGGPAPRLALMIAYGSANLPVDEIPGLENGTILHNTREMSQITGAGKTKTHPSGDAAGQEEAADALSRDRTFLTVGAFDLAALRRHRKVMLWRTSMSIDTLQQDFGPALRAMLASGSEYFGVAVDHAVTVHDADRAAHVEVGAPRVVPAK